MTATYTARRMDRDSWMVAATDACHAIEETTQRLAALESTGEPIGYYELITPGANKQYFATPGDMVAYVRWHAWLTRSPLDLRVVNWPTSCIRVCS